MIEIDSLSIMGSTISLKPSMPPSTPRRWADQPTGGNLVSTAVDWLFRGIDSECGIARRAADSLALRDFLVSGWHARRSTTRRFRAGVASSISKRIVPFHMGPSRIDAQCTDNQLLLDLFFE